MHVNWPIAGAFFVGTFAIISYTFTAPGPEARVVVGMIVATALVILAVALLDRYARRARTKL
jgi:hypothetical protein